jgi:hypothetical protein
MAEADESLPNIEALLEELSASNKEIQDKTTVLADGSDKEQKVEENIVGPPPVNSSLTGDEKARYSNIGKEMFAPILSSLEKMLKNEKKKNDMTIAGGDEQEMSEGLKIQYEPQPEPEEKSENGWMDKLMEAIGWLAIGAMMFGPKIIEFFEGAWNWVTDLFGTIASFFDFSEGPIAAILSICGGALKGLWKLVEGVFKGLATVGTWIWNGIKSIFNAFISGPNGILNFGMKIVNGIINFAKNAVKWLGDLIMSAILAPIKAIFGGAEETAQSTGEEAAKDTSAQASQVVAQQEVAAKAVSDKAIMSQQGAEQEWAKCVANSRAEAKKRAKEANLKVNADGTISDDSIKAKIAEDMLKNFEAENGKLDEDERKEMLEAMKKEVQVKDGKFKVDAERVRQAMIKTAKSIDSRAGVDSEALDKIEKLSTQQINAMSSGIGQLGQKYLDIQTKANVQNELDKMSEEEQFLWRMQQAKESGQLAEFRLSEARQMITKSMNTIKETFGSYDKMLTDNFISAIKIFVQELRDNIKITITPFTLNDNSKDTFNISSETNNSHQYNIMPVSKEDFKMTNNELVSITREGTEIVAKQNVVLNKIKEILESTPEAKTVNITTVKKINRSTYGYDESSAEAMEDMDDSFIEKAGNAISDMAGSIKEGLWKAASSFFD